MNMQAKVQTEVLREAAATGVLDVAEVCSHVPGADCRDVARAVELLTARHLIDLPDGPAALAVRAPAEVLVDVYGSLNVEVTDPTRTRVILLPDATVDLRTAADCAGVEFRDIVSAVAGGQLRASEDDPGRPGVWLVRAGDLFAWAGRHVSAGDVADS